MTHAFFKLNGPFTISDIAQWVSADCHSPLTISSAASLNNATPQDIACFHNTKYKEDLKNTKAGAVLIVKDFINEVPQNTIPIIVDSPYRAFGLVLSKLYKNKTELSDQRHLSYIHPSVTLGDNCIIGPYCVIN